MPDPLEKVFLTWLSPIKDTFGKCYLVGGAIRDWELDRPVTEIDLACEHPQKLAKALANTNKAATVSFKKKSTTPTFRLISRTDANDRLDITGLAGGSISADLDRRDFTINAMAIRIYPDGRTGKLIDPHNGIQALRQKSIEVVQPNAIAKDPIRILRAVRFSAELGFSISPVTIEAMRAYAHRLSKVAGERIWTELERILLTPKSTFFIRRLDEIGALSQLFPEIDAMKSCPQNAHHHLDVWSHSLMVLRHCEQLIHDPKSHFAERAKIVNEYLALSQRTALLKLVALLHDIGKPYARGLNPTTGRITFYGHDQVGAEMMLQAGRRLKLSSSQSKYLTTMVAKHLQILTLAQPEVRPSTRIRLFRQMGDDTISLLIHGMADVLATRGPEANQAYSERYLAWAIKVIGAYHCSIKPRLSPRSDLLRGKDLLTMGAKQGPGLGKMLERIRRAQDDGEIKNRNDVLALAKRMIAATY